MIGWIAFACVLAAFLAMDMMADIFIRTIGRCRLVKENGKQKKEQNNGEKEDHESKGK